MSIKILAMGANEILAVDTLSVAEFQRTIQARLDEAHAMLAKLDPAIAGPHQPKLGAFQDAQETGQRHDQLHEEFLARLRRLIDALTAIQERTGTIIDKYHTVEELNSAKQRELLHILLSRFDG